MNAIELLESQHREVENLFSQIEGTRDSDEKDRLFIELADRLAVHTSIEELTSVRWQGGEVRHAPHPATPSRGLRRAPQRPSRNH